ncbi:glucosaminidase domain-containing protein [Eremococcus coleocola]|uniref:glucosaminidase domain-containing protein n=1 Tax=Eremococcus coleocola TaxID=88132 RepID=UPI0003F854FF|nr:glucosaminidase domain-containing protein [Eremococcus coleocola]
MKEYTPTLLPSVLIAQAILESDWGRSELAVNAHNLGGIKAQPEYAKYKKLTTEYIDGSYQQVYADFAMFKDDEAYVNYHIRFFTRSDYAKSRYATAVNAKTYEAQAKALTGVYATDPEYDSKLVNVIRKYELYKYDTLNNSQVDKELNGGDGAMELRTPIREITRVNSFGRGSNKPKFIVIHYVGASGNAKANADYFLTVNHDASAHYFIDKNYTYQVVEEDAGAWHVGDGNTTKKGEYNGYVTPGLCTNYNSIGIEMCLTPIPGKPVTDWAIDPIVVEQTRLLTLALMKKYNIPASNVIRHFDVSTKLCPAPWRFNNWAKWWDFKKTLTNGITTPNQDKSISRFIDLPEYKSPVKPFKEMKVGDKVTIRENMSAWYNPQTKEGVKPSKDFSGDKDVITKVMDVNVGYSKKAYLLKDKVSWILEQDLIEPRAGWVEVKEDLTEEDKQSNRYIVWDGKRYEVK